MTFNVPMRYFTDGADTSEWRHLFNADDIIEAGAINFFDVVTVDRINEDGVNVIMHMGFGQQHGDEMVINTVSIDDMDVMREFVHSIVAAYMSLDPVMRRAATSLRDKVINEMGLDGSGDTDGSEG